MGINETEKEKELILVAIHKFCLDCIGDSLTELVNCSMPKCPLYVHRLGPDPESVKAKLERLSNLHKFKGKPQDS